MPFAILQVPLPARSGPHHWSLERRKLASFSFAPGRTIDSFLAFSAMKTTIEDVTDLDPTRNDEAFRRMLNEVPSVSAAKIGDSLCLDQRIATILMLTLQNNVWCLFCSFVP
jgi:hypothetical protein